MDTRDRVAHILRRFGLGASPSELDTLAPLGVEGAMEWLLAWEQTDEKFPVSYWEFCLDEGKPDVYLDPQRTLGWWSLRLLMTRRPLQEKLTLFWHDHFAVSAEKVEFGPAMYMYLQALRENAGGRFVDLLKAVSKTPAMLRWLDADASIKGRPNENFGREVLELFTLGRGNYTERDVQEAARAFTGWGIRYIVFEAGGENVQQRARESIANSTPMIAFAVSPDLQDTGMKTILGKTAAWTGDQLLEELASRPETAKLISRKLFEFFAHESAPTTAVDRLAGVFRATGGDIKAVLRAISRSEEFWSDKAIRRLVKSPVDFTLPILRQLELTPFLLASHPAKETPTKAAPKTLRDASGLVAGTLFQQGMLLLFPPTVAGWDWGQAWITSNNMTQRIKLADTLLNMYDGKYPLADLIGLKLKGSTTSGEAVSKLLALFDAPILPQGRAILEQALEKAGGIGAIGSGEANSRALTAVCRLIFGAPEFQFY